MFCTDLVKPEKFINLYTQGDVEKPLPSGWKQFPGEKRNIYANLASEFTTFYHPALLENENKSENKENTEPEQLDAHTEQAEQPPEEESGQVLEYQDQVVIFLVNHTNEQLIGKGQFYGQFWSFLVYSGPFWSTFVEFCLILVSFWSI